MKKQRQPYKHLKRKTFLDIHLGRGAKALATLPDNLKTLLLFALSPILVIYPTKEK